MIEMISQTSTEGWLFFSAFIIGGFLAAKICYWFLSKIVKQITKKTRTNLDDILVDKLEEPIAFAIALVGYYMGLQHLNLEMSPEEIIKLTKELANTTTDDAKAIIEHKLNVSRNSLGEVLYGIGKMAIAIDITWLVARVLDSLIEEYVIPITNKTESTFDDQLIPILRKGAKSIIWITGLVIGLDNLGVNVTGMIAGLGIGGLALALAAQDAVKNIFGGIMIFLDKPFEMGQRIQVDGFDGTVEEVGLRSTRVRTLEGRKVTIPNNSFSDNSIINVSSEPNRKVVLNLGLTYDTTPENMKLAMDLLHQIVEKHSDKIEADNYAVGFDAFGDFAMGIKFIYRIKSGADILSTQTDVNMEILSLYNQNKLEFAFPTQTVFVNQ